MEYNWKPLTFNESWGFDDVFDAYAFATGPILWDVREGIELARIELAKEKSSKK